MKRGRWIALSLGLPLLLGGIGWLTRYTWLPHALFFFLQAYRIDRLRYEGVLWEHPTDLQFTGVLIEKGRWELEADKVRVRVGKRPALHVWGGRLRMKATWEAPAEPPTRPLAPQNLLASLLAWLAKLDTLEMVPVELPYNLRLQVSKQGKGPFPFLIEHPQGCLQGEARLEPNQLHFTAQPGEVGGAAYLRWERLAGSLQVRAETLSLTLQGWRVEGYHPRLASRVLRYDSVGGVAVWIHRPDTPFIELRPLLLPLQATLQLRWTPEPLSWSLQLQVPPQPHQAYLEAFPKGFFTCLSKAWLGGRSALQLHLRYHPALPDTLGLEVTWQPEGFTIQRWEGFSPLHLREPFWYRPYRSTREIWVGPENPAFLSFRQITPYVLLAVLHSEDGLFFQHQGFHKAHLLRAILENWRCRCFRRGAGTLTMQVVRNTLLNREKTLARKVEEVLLTALIERFRLLSKERLAELYFNIVEWGPEVYGLTEAAHFYFAKEPQDLTIPEALFLGAILPSPRAYRYFVEEKTHCALPSLSWHFRKIAGFLVLQHYLPPDSVETIKPERACLTGPAQRLLQAPASHDTLP
ncbi:MAG: hypothetical protein KatS3mg026_1475 [Bacteroidia bacterium]|nr:MAG: hypothetical protein KatS3mg026_1475 [Bacteroidia bacterium]